MSCREYLLSEDEITKICSSFLIIGNSVAELQEIINEPFAGVATKKHGTLTHIARLEAAIENLRPLVTHLYELQKEEK